MHLAEEKFLAQHLGGRYQAGGLPDSGETAARDND
jgi:hypothetical protein